MFRLWYHFDLSHKFTVAQASIQEKLSNCFKKQLQSKFGETACYSESCVLSPSAAVGFRRLVVILAHETHYPSDDLCWHRLLQTTQLQWWNEVVIQYHKKKERQGLIVLPFGRVCANCCCMPIGNTISDRAPRCLLKMRWHHKERLCVAVRDWHQRLLAWDGPWAVEHLWTRMV